MQLGVVVESKRILIADDDPEITDLVAHVVARLGHDVKIAASGGELLDEIAGAGPFDLVITDVAMPWMTGVQVMQSVRTAGMTCPVIVLTALRDQGTARQVEALGVEVQLLYKPFSVHDLESAIVQALAAPMYEEHA
jgi:two-component system, NarL family, capsular synthesis sensor histidine kinase RcsC